MDLARQVRTWHTTQSDRLPFEQCKLIAAALQGCPGWSALSQRSSTRAPLDSKALLAAVTRLKQFGYTAPAATALITFVIEPDDTEPFVPKGTTLR